MGDTTRLKDYKNFNSEIDIIVWFQQLEKQEISLEKIELFNTKGILTNKEEGISIEINDMSFSLSDRFEEVNEVKIQLDAKTFFIDSFKVGTLRVNTNENEVTRSHICSCNIFKTESFNNVKSKYKCFIPTDEPILNTFMYQIETVTYQDDKSDYFYNCLRIQQGKFKFDILQVKTEAQGFYVIDSLDEIDFQTFNDYCFSIKQALGFITSYMPGGEEFIFSDKENWYYSNYIRKSISSIYVPIHTNPYRRLYNKKEIAEKYMNKLTVLKLDNLSNLISLIHNNQEFSVSILLLLEASSVRSLIMIPSLFSVVVESLSKIISTLDEDKVFPIDDKEKAKRIKKELKKILAPYEKSISSKGFNKLIGRIDNINSPTIKKHLTNNEKLILPFEQLDIELLENDIKTIEHRNDLLHGNILLLDGSIKTGSEIDNYMGYVSAKLYTLISILILKHIGYSGYVINQSKYYKKSSGVNTDEEYYRLI